jgi:HEAT repeat protein
MNELHAIAQRLNELATKKPNAAARREVMQALQAKARGIRINAAKALAAWGDKESIESLKSLLAEYVTQTQDRFNGDLSVLIKLLIPHIEKLDREWVIDLYFTRYDIKAESYLRELLFAFPFKATASSLAARYRSGKNLDQIPGLLNHMQLYAFVRRRKD